VTAREAHCANAFTLEVGGVRLRFEAVDPDIVMRLAFPRTRFVVPDSRKADCVVRVRVGAFDLSPQPAVFGTGGPWELQRRPDGGDRVSFWTQLDDTAREPMMQLDLSPGLERGDLIVQPRYASEGEFAIGYPLDEYLFARLLARRGSVVLHASAIADGGGALVFAGHSGAGKSTISEIAEKCGAELLSDDRTVLMVRDGAVMAAGTPWHGSLASGSPAQLPVRAVFLLEQAGSESVESIGEARAFSELMVRLVRPTAELAEQTAFIDALQDVVRLIPVATLRFRPRPEALDAARRFTGHEPYAQSDRHLHASLNL
jgi:hypothetical protein